MGRGCWATSGRIYILHRQKCVLPQSSCLLHPTTGSLPSSPQTSAPGLYLAGCDLLHIISLSAWFEKHHRYAHYCHRCKVMAWPISGLFHRRGLGTGFEHWKALRKSKQPRPLSSPKAISLLSPFDPCSNFSNAQHNAKEATETSGQGCISIKLYLYKQTVAPVFCLLLPLWCL